MTLPPSSTPSATIEITAPARLHFGLLAFGRTDSDAGRQFGGAGVMLAEPALRLRIRAAEEYEVFASNHFAADLIISAQRFLTRMRARLPTSPPTRGPCAVDILAAPSAHVGLGSGTQLGLAVALGVAQWHDVPIESLGQLVRLAGRGERSAVGSHGFLRGGLIIEPGKLPDEALAPLAARVTLPPAWRIVLITPRIAAGLSGEAERAAFANLPPVPLNVTKTLAAELLMHLLPASQTADFDRFSQSLYRYGLLAGECFSAAQGGPFANAQVAAIIHTLRARGIAGVGQSSWGPLVFCWCESACAAAELTASLESDPLTTACDLTITAPAEHGVMVNGEPWEDKFPAE